MSLAPFLVWIALPFHYPWNPARIQPPLPSKFAGRLSTSV